MRAVGVEPTAHGLKDRCSTSELRPHAVRRNILQRRLFRSIALYAPCTPAMGSGTGVIEGRGVRIFPMSRDSGRHEKPWPSRIHDLEIPEFRKRLPDMILQRGHDSVHQLLG